MIKYRQGDLFEHIPKNGENIIVVPHVCNNQKLMKSGFALGVIKKYPIVELANKSTELGETEFVYVEPHVIIANMISQYKTIREVKKPIRYKALIECMTTISNRIKELKLFSKNAVEIWTCKFGSKRAGGNWDFIVELIDELWSDMPVTVFEYKE